MALTDQEREDALRRVRDNLEVHAAFCAKIKSKSGAIIPFVFNRAQRHIHRILEEQKKNTGKVRALILKGRQQGACLDPETLVLTADLRWIKLRHVSVGQELVATDEHPTLGLGQGNGSRKMRTSVVEKVWRTRRPAYRITFDDGRSVVCSAEHRWLSRKSQPQAEWRSISGGGNALDNRDALRVGDLIRSVATKWGDSTLGDAWFGGVVDGEGSLDYKTRTGVDLAVSQRAGRVLDRMISHCNDRVYKFCIVSDDGPRKTKLGQDPVHAISISNMPDVMRLIGLSRPERFIESRCWVGKRMPCGGWRKIAAIDPVGEMGLIDLQTTTGTFVAEGFVSHNSTYIGERFYHQVSTRGKSAFIVAHEDKATSNLYEMVRRYQDNNPLAPSTKATNAKELLFSVLDCGYKLATAGTKDVGRSNTAQLLHGSEFAFWANAQSHLAALGNTIADMDDTEIILESTGNGLGNAFHLMWQEAEAGRGEYIAIFVPWFWQDEYRAEVKPDFALDELSHKYQQAYGLDLEQMQWRANKISTYGQGFEWLFDQEYPATAALAFQTSTQNPLINPSDVMAAVNSQYLDMNAPLVIGCDPAGDGVNDPDRTAVAFRRGRVCFRIEYHSDLDTMQIAGKLAEYWSEMEPDGMFIDKGGLGAGVYDRLIELGFPVIGINNASRATDAERFENKRAEIWWTMRDWFADQPCRMPNDASLISDLTAPQPKVSSNGRKLLEKKEDMAKRQVRSPDGADALSLTFAEPVAFRTVLNGPRANSKPSATTAGY